MPQKKIERNPLQSLNLQFNVKKRIAITLQNIAQPRQLRNLLGRRARYINSAHLRIMANHRLFIFCQSHIELKPIAPIGQCVVE